MDPNAKPPGSIWEEGRILLIDKPLTWTSFDAVKKIRNTIRHKKVGHAGTLDPLATGLLIICTGKYTKKIDALMAGTKEYWAEITFGATTPSYDAETEPNATFSTEHITKELLVNEITKLTGAFEQMPPMYSAIKIDGRALYKDARKGIEVERKARPVEIHSFEVLDYQDNKLTCLITCSKGTYIRSLAQDLGALASSGAYLTALRRTKIGPHSVDSAFTIDQFLDLHKSGHAFEECK
jgi:tRNA pseudouridine55 synthase